TSGLPLPWPFFLARPGRTCGLNSELCGADGDCVTLKFRRDYSQDAPSIRRSMLFDTARNFFAHDIGKGLRQSSTEEDHFRIYEVYDVRQDNSNHACSSPHQFFDGLVAGGYRFGEVTASDVAEIGTALLQ